MFLPDIFYCNQYHELVTTGRDGSKALKNGLILSAVCLTLNIMTLFYIVLAVDRKVFDSFSSMSRYVEGKYLGQVLAIVLVSVIYFTLKKIRGDEAYFGKVISGYKMLSEADQKAIHRKAYVYCFGSIVLLIVCIFI